MPYTLSRIYSLTAEEIDRQVTPRLPGVYALDRVPGAPFTVYRIGRSDDDLNGRLKEYVGTKYKWFKFDYASSPKNAFEKECELWHDFEGKLDNEIHPDRPDGTNWKCPRCNVFG